MMSRGNVYHTGGKVNLMLQRRLGSNDPEKIHRDITIGALGADTLVSERE